MDLARIASAGQAREGRLVGWWFILRSNIKKIFIEISEDIDQNNMDLARIASAGQAREGRVVGWWLAAGDKWTAGPASRQTHTPLCQAGLIMLNTKDSYGQQVDDNKG